MNTTNDRIESDILFSRTVKAGRRVYYVDVKQDRRGGFYVSVTESKRVRDGLDGQAPVFEKHKIFLYREDLQKFMEAFSEAADFTASQPEVIKPAPSGEAPEAQDSAETAEPEGEEKKASGEDFSWEF